MYFHKYSLVGAGNMATAMATALHEAGCEIVDICSAHYEHASVLAQKVGAAAVRHVAQMRPLADAVLLAVPDNVIGTLEPPRHSWTVLHTAGSVPMDILGDKADSHGVLWPVCSLRKGQACTLSGVPVCIEASDGATLARLHALAELLGAKSMEVTSEQRLRLHLAAVVVNNFGNALHALTQEWLAAEGLSMDILAPLALQTAQGFHGNLWQRQTGPAVRGDAATMQRHIELLASNPDLQRLYSLFSSIIGQHTDA